MNYKECFARQTYWWNKLDKLKMNSKLHHVCAHMVMYWSKRCTLSTISESKEWGKAANNVKRQRKLVLNEIRRVRSKLWPQQVCKHLQMVKHTSIRRDRHDK